MYMCIYLKKPAADYHESCICCHSNRPTQCLTTNSKAMNASFSFVSTQSAIQKACALGVGCQSAPQSSKFHSSIFIRFRAPSRPQINSFIILKIVDHSIPVGKLANSFQQLWPVAKQKSGFKIKVKISMKCHKSAIDL